MTDELTTILGPGSVFEGKLTFSGAVRIDGRFEGEIHAAGTLVVGTTAEVRATLQAASLVVEGTFRGTAVLREGASLRAGSRVEGTLVTPSLEVEKGATWDGTCQMAPRSDDASDSATPEPEPPPDATPPDPTAEPA